MLSQSAMDIMECYRLLELTSAASLEDVKASYRRLARRLHPDVNPNNNQAHDQFIRITAAYKTLLKIAGTRSQPAAQTAPSTPQPEPTVKANAVDQPVAESVSPEPPAPATTSVSDEPSAPASDPPQTAASEETYEPTFAEQKLKFDTYRQIEDLLKRRSLPRAIALVEALQTRLPQDPEVRQWQAIIYQRWGRQLIEERKLNQARAYLKKALKTDPHNKSLWTEIENDFRRMERVY